jgi:predicted RNA-binding protein Jag
MILQESYGKGSPVKETKNGMVEVQMASFKAIKKSIIHKSLQSNADVTSFSS